MEPKKKIKRFEGLEMKEESRYRMGGSLTNLVMTPSGVERPQYRYLMEIPTPGGVTECWVNCEKPSCHVNHDRVNYMFDTAVVGTRYEWQPIRVILRDVFNGDGIGEVGRFLMDWFQDYSNGQYARTYKRRVTIKMIDPTGVIYETWHLQGAFPSAVTFNDFSYDHTERDLEFTLTYDRAIINV